MSVFNDNMLYNLSDKDKIALKNTKSKMSMKYFIDKHPLWVNYKNNRLFNINNDVQINII